MGPLGLVFLIAVLPSSLEQDEDIPHNEVKNWALKFGVDLWEFGRQFTKMSEMQKKYREHDVRVVRKDGLILIREMAAELKNMMDMKINAVLRIMDSAEQAALSHKMDDSVSARYVSSHFMSGVSLTTNRHFDHNPVNTNFSSVLMPAQVTDTDSSVQNGIKWSEHLDPLFVNNYEMDPSLSWQYFGSSSGFLRRYPAVQWPPMEGMAGGGVYDFRSSTWYLGAATSPKDVVVLVDASSGMSTRASDAAKAVVHTVLDTLSNNDFVSVFRFAETTEEIVPCFQNALVQATSYNIRELRLAVDKVTAGAAGANFTSALGTAFELLQRYNRSGQGSQCNQAILLLTNGPPSAFPEVFRQFNFPHHPVRVFTFLLGKEGSNANDMEEMACSNKGYYTRVVSGADSQRAVRHCTEVLARPLVMYQHEHPIHWTPVYAGGQPNTFRPGSQQQLMTSVSTPVFDRRNYSTRSAKLLGVVGTDVAILQIQKLVPQYRVGANGYSFIVDNNGHLLYHPDLRPLYRKGEFQETLRPQYSSVDLTEVELVDPEHGFPMENNTILLDLRHDLIDQKEGETELGVIIHYDNMKRVMSRRHRYFYNAIDGTPFSLGLAVPEGYGMYEVRGTLEIKHSQVNVLEYFKGSNWRIHPDWVYCEYNYASEHWFESAEEQLLHFLERTHKPGWKWMSLRPRSPVKETGHTIKKMERDSYFCDKELTQSLVYDAMITDHLDRHVAPPADGNNQQGYQMFGVQRSFVATRSGLVRWHDHGTDPSPMRLLEGGGGAVDAVWYQRAVHQHTIEPESFVFTVPFDVDAHSRPLVTVTHAVFVEHKGHRAPAAVVGLQFLHSSLASHFINITSACTGGTECRRNCAARELDCYILDNNGFIILSESNEHTGKFFGQVDGTIMDSLVQDRIYKKVPVVDHQGACYDDHSAYHGAAHRPRLHYSPLRMLWRWVVHATFWLCAEAQLWGPSPSDDIDYSDYGAENVPYGAFSGPDGPLEEVRFPSNTNAPPAARYQHSPRNASTPRPCRQLVQLYNLQPDRLNNSGIFNPLKGKLTNCHSSGCERPFSVQKIPHSNLILLVVDTLCPCGSKQLSIAPQELVDTACRRKPQELMYRRRPTKCINYHPEEIEIKECSGAMRRGAGAEAATGAALLSLLVLS